MVGRPQWYLSFVPYGSPQGIYSITIEQDSEPITSDALELRISHNLQAGRPQSVTVKGWHPKKKQIISNTATMGGIGPTQSWQYEVPTPTMDQVTKRSKSEAMEKARHEFIVSATVVGDPSVQAGMGLQLNGTDFDQVFEIDAVHHDFGMSGHLTHITARSPKSGRSAS
jgi:hypothetical protein